jgi:anthranilate phosphoribosyltransferase
MSQVMSGDATPAQIAGFAVALRSKGETAAEMAGLSGAMLDNAHQIEVTAPALDIVGTGGDRSHTVNISTMSALVAAGAGARVVKHGNRAASSNCGTADVLEELGVQLTLPPQAVAECAETVGITFCFAVVFHPALRHAAAVRKELGVGTSFNFLGPLTNPAQPIASAVGCADRRMAPIMAQVFAERQKSALVFRGDDGLDELTVSTTSSVWHVADGRVTELSLDPEELGIQRAGVETLRGGDKAHNASVVRALLDGSERGPIRDAVLLNAAAGLTALDAVSAGDVTAGIAAGLKRAAESIDSGAAAAVLDRWVETTRTLA